MSQSFCTPLYYLTFKHLLLLPAESNRTSVLFDGNRFDLSLPSSSSDRTNTLWTDFHRSGLPEHATCIGTRGKAPFFGRKTPIVNFSEANGFFVAFLPREEFLTEHLLRNYKFLDQNVV